MQEITFKVTDELLEEWHTEPTETEDVSSFFDLFKEAEDYPNKEAPSRWNTFYNYAGNRYIKQEIDRMLKSEKATLLSPTEVFEPLFAILLGNYRDWDDESNEVHQLTEVNKEQINRFIANGSYPDDVLLLFRVLSEENAYCFLWLDCDTSNSGFGLFRTMLPTVEMMVFLEDLAKTYEAHNTVDGQWIANIGKYRVLFREDKV